MKVNDARTRAILGGGATALLASLIGCGVDGGQANLCQAVAHELAETAATISIDEMRGAEDGHAVVISFTQTDPAGDSKASTVTCRFAGRRFQEGRLDLVAVETKEFGLLSPLQLAFLRRTLGLPPPQ